MSAKLQPRARLEAYVILKRVVEAYVLWDVATKTEVTAVTLPVHADRLVPLEVQELSAPIDEQTKVIFEGVHTGRIVAQAVDRRIEVELADRTREGQLYKTYKKLGTSLNGQGGVWLDLAQFDHYFND